MTNINRTVDWCLFIVVLVNNSNSSVDKRNLRIDNTKLCLWCYLITTVNVYSVHSSLAYFFGGMTSIQDRVTTGVVFNGKLVSLFRIFSGELTVTFCGSQGVFISDKTCEFGVSRFWGFCWPDFSPIVFKNLLFLPYIPLSEVSTLKEWSLYWDTTLAGSQIFPFWIVTGCPTLSCERGLTRLSCYSFDLTCISFICCLAILVFTVFGVNWAFVDGKMDLNLLPISNCDGE